MEAKKVLVINDESETNLLISFALKNRGYLIDNSNNLESGKSVFRNFKPDLLFLDINLPDGNGLMNINFFKNLQPNVKICMISANEEVNKSHDFNADSFLTKPFSLVQILDKTKDLIG
ncbi:MAG: response regulator [Bacteroidota bacterium]|nr:response regulator [Bacteroidota bacterium]